MPPWNGKNSAVKIAKRLIQDFNTMLVSLSQTNNKFIVAKTPGTLAKNEWGDEIHPTSKGFVEQAVGAAGWHGHDLRL